MENQNNEEYTFDLSWKNDLVKEADKIKAEGLYVETISVTWQSRDLLSVLPKTESKLLLKCPGKIIVRLCMNINFSENATLTIDDMSAINDFANVLGDNVDFTWYVESSNHVQEGEISIEAVGGFANK